MSARRSGDARRPGRAERRAKESDEDRMRRRARRRGAVAITTVLAALVVLGGAGYAVLSAAAFDRIPRNTALGGVDVGGLAYSPARERIQRAAAASAARPVALTGAGFTGSVVPGRAGVLVDVSASLDAAGPVTSRSPIALVRGLFASPRRLDPVLSVDRARLDAAVAGAAAGYDRPVREASVVLVGSRPQVVEPLAGRRVDRARTGAAVVRAVARGDSVATVVAGPVAPRTSAASVRQVVDVTVPGLLAGPVRLVARGRSADLSTTQLADHTTFRARGDRLVPVVDAAGLRTERPDPLAALETPARDAGFTVSGAAAVLAPGTDGVAVDDVGLSAAVAQAAAARGGGRVVPVPTRIVGPRVTTRALAALGVQRVVGQYTGRYPAEAGLATNLGRAGARLNGQVVGPGAILSLNRLLGQRTRAAGYVDGPALAGGQFTTALGGGVGQAATVLYAAAHAAGWGIESHTPASVWTGVGPPGRDATISWPGIDLVLRNDTPAPAYIQVEDVAATPGADGTFTVRLLSRPWWSVRTSTSRPVAVVRPAVVRRTGPGCVPRTGSYGFRVTDRRTRTRPGAAPESYVFITTYRPSPTVTCG